MRKILSIIGIYLLSFIYFVMILFLSHLTNTYALRTTITHLDLINSLTGLLFFPVSLIWFRALIRNTRDNPGATSESALNRGVDSSAYFLAVQTSNATVLIPGGYDSIIFKILLLFCIDLTLYIFSLPLLILMILSKIFNWHLFETIIISVRKPSLPQRDETFQAYFPSRSAETNCPDSRISVQIDFYWQPSRSTESPHCS